MTFYVNRTLASGAIRFGVGERAAEAPATGEGFSTGPAGEFRRRSAEGLFFSDGEGRRGEFDALAAVAKRDEMLIPWWGWVSVGFGALLMILGPLVVMNKGYQSGWVEAGVGVGFIALPFVLTAKKRRSERARRERERAENEAAEADLRRIAGAYVDAVRGFRSADDAAALEAVRTARAGKEIPYERVRSAACDAVHRAAFDTLDATAGDPRRVARAIDTVADACGVSEDDLRSIRMTVLQKAWWHLLADDRLTPERRARLEELRDALGIREADVALDRRAAEEFERLRGIGPKSLPRIDCTIRLRPLETCLHITHGGITEPRMRRVIEPDGRRRRDEHWKEGPEEEITITSQRVIATDGKKFEVEIRALWDIEVDADLGIVALVEGGEKKRTRYLRVPDAIYTAGVIQAAASAPLKPKGLV